MSNNLGCVFPSKLFFFFNLLFIFVVAFQIIVLQTFNVKPTTNLKLKKLVVAKHPTHARLRSLVQSTLLLKFSTSF